MALPIMGIIGGATQIAGSLIGGGRRRREARAAAAEFESSAASFLKIFNLKINTLV